MKKLIFGILTLFCLLACESEETIVEEFVLSTPLAGKWQRVEQKVSIGGPATWEKVDNGDTFILQADGSFSDFQLFNDCQTGTYEATEDELTLTYNCNTNTKPFTYSLKKENEDIIISPKTVICTESCEYKYRKIGE